MHGSRVPERANWCARARSEAAAKRGAGIYAAAIIAKIGFPVQFTGFRLQNVVATVNVGWIQLARWPSHITRGGAEPELFPADLSVARAEDGHFDLCLRAGSS